MQHMDEVIMMKKKPAAKAAADETIKQSELNGEHK